MGKEEDITCEKRLQPMPNAFRELGGEQRQPQLSCDHICSFSDQTYNLIDMAQRSKSSVKLRRLIMFYIVIMVVEIVGGVKSNSLAVLTDAVHMLSDIAGFSISLFTLWVSGWEATPRQSFGFSRLEVLGALLSTQLIWIISGILIYEAIERLLHQNELVNGKLMFAISAFGFIINLIMVIWIGHDHSHHGHSHNSCTDADHSHEMEDLTAGDTEEFVSLPLTSPHGSPILPLTSPHGSPILPLTSPHGSPILPLTSPHGSPILNINIQGAYLHVMTDLIQSVGVMIAGFVIWFKPDWLVVDLICTLIFSIFALTTTLPMLKNIFRILMESTPVEIDVVSLESGLKDIKGLENVHDLHVWAITAGKFVLACHVVTEPGANASEILQSIREYCKKAFKIFHVTVQIEQR